MTTDVTYTVITLFIIAALGLLMKKTRVSDKRTDRFVSIFLVNYAVPAMMVHTTYTGFTLETLRVSWVGISLAAVSILLMMVIALAVSRMSALPPRRRGEFIAMSAFSNTIFIGLPMIESIFGAPGVPYLMLYYVANVVLFWSIGIYYISKSNNRGFSFEALLKILNPAILGFVAGLLLLRFQVPIPGYAMSTLEYMKNLVTPLSLVYMGSTLGDLTWKNIGNPVTTVLVLLLRFILSPLIVILLSRVVPLPDLLLRVFIVSAGLPVMGNVAIAVGKYGGDASYASFMTALTTILMLFVLPFYFFLFRFVA